LEIRKDASRVFYGLLVKNIVSEKDGSLFYQKWSTALHGRYAFEIHHAFEAATGV